MIDEINRLKKAKNAIILAHNYQRPEIYKVADYIDDSLNLCKYAANTSAKIILFCGVNFMAESAAILNPTKKVIVPYLDAGCSLADMITADELRALKKKHPNAKVVCYVNSSAEVKAESYICCTSANAIKVVKSIPEKEVIFVPDKNLANYVAQHVRDKKIITCDGFCPVHHSLTKEYIKEVVSTYPNAKLIAHPECRVEVSKMADYVVSTSKMIDCVEADPSNEFFILTECGMVDRLKLRFPKKKFYGLCNLCFDMKKNTLESVLKCLISEKPVVRVDPKIAKRANLAFKRMFDLV